ncbi:MAG: 7-carboxy-7-deazaguanine synthase QueE [Candidatus Omnitrophota bacterium]|nr:7-carboxy-7-deazaguanine synthase QueE [Candidatus Omnitrophota bacterium]MBU1928569.1 7-carboxy-7-deazaguanine synthase QueE [Candidatus Omnitrophota bacterium]MBU2034582.1 7-carboxy-7-deazaguanine synthase QueE [Candidatus Omnitrophota bacterium]MBU2257737.1 7-carboxy-7-deazaguanine synthase QueE [Candidatus Omnitrophota bacterium]
MKGKISEIFESIQGEGIYAGQRQIFVRFFGCNLSCKFCDTPLKNFSEYESQELLNELKSYLGNYHSISFTGGEPLLQKDFLKEVLILAKQEGFRNYLETNGTLPEALKEVIDYVDIIAMDFKLSSSTNSGDFLVSHREFLKIASAKDVFLKAVICNSTGEDDFKKSLEVIKEIKPDIRLVLQPNCFEDSGSLDEKIDDLKTICLRQGIGVCLIPQMHKIIGVK